MKAIPLNSAIWRLNIATMLFFTLVQMVVPLIPRYALVFGASPSMIGVAVSSISVTAIALRPFFGLLSDKWVRSSLMILGAVLASISYALLFLSESIYTIMVARLIEGAAVASFIPSSIASAVDSAPEGRVGEMLGWRSLMVGIGFTVGPGIGGILSQFFSYRVTFIIASLLLLTIIPLIKTSENNRKSFGGIYVGGLGNKYFLTAFLSLIIYAVSWMGLITFLSAYLKLLGYGDIEIGFFVSLQALSSLMLRIIAGKLSDKYPEKTTYLSLLIISSSFFMIYIFTTPPYLYLASIVFGVGVGIFIPSCQTLALGRRRRCGVGFLTSIYTMGMDIGNLIGPVILGLIVQYSGNYMNAFLIPPILTLTAGILVLLISESIM